MVRVRPYHVLFPRSTYKYRLVIIPVIYSHRIENMFDFLSASRSDSELYLLLMVVSSIDIKALYPTRYGARNNQGITKYTRLNATGFSILG